MKRTVLQILLLASLAGWCSGCATVPQTRVGIDPKTGMFTLESPKQVKAQRIRVKVVPGGGVEVELEGYSSYNDSEVLGVIATANAQMTDRVLTFTEKSLEKGAKGVAEGAVPGP